MAAQTPSGSAITSAGAANAVTLLLLAPTKDTFAQCQVGAGTATWTGGQLRVQGSRDAVLPAAQGPGTANPNPTWFDLGVVDFGSQLFFPGGTAIVLADGVARAFFASIPGLNGLRVWAPVLVQGSIGVAIATDSFFVSGPSPGGPVTVAGGVGPQPAAQSVSTVPAPDAYKASTGSPLTPAGGPGPIAPVPVLDDRVVQLLTGTNELLKELLSVMHVGL